MWLIFHYKEEGVSVQRYGTYLVTEFPYKLIYEDVCIVLENVTIMPFRTICTFLLSVSYADGVSLFPMYTGIPGIRCTYDKPEIVTINC